MPVSATDPATAPVSSLDLAIQEQLRATATYLQQKHAAVPDGLLLQVRQQYQALGALEKRIDGAALEGKLSVVTELCREYCRTWNGRVAAALKKHGG